LDVARRNQSAIPQAVSMLHIAVENIRDRFDAPVRVPGKTF